MILNTSKEMTFPQVAIIVKALSVRTAMYNTSHHTAINKFKTFGSRQEIRNGSQCHNQQATTATLRGWKGLVGNAEINVTAARTNFGRL